MENGERENADQETHSQSGRQYTPVVTHDRTVLQMSSIEPVSLPAIPLKKLNVRSQVKMDPSTRGESSDSHGASNGSQNESKLELFGFDSLVNILGLKSMTGEQIPAPSSPRDGEDVAITLGQPKQTGPKLGTMMGVFVPCLQNILGIIYYIRFSWTGMTDQWLHRNISFQISYFSTPTSSDSASFEIRSDPRSNRRLRSAMPISAPHAPSPRV